MKIALITGGSGGIGAAIAETLSQAGLHVIVHANSNPDQANFIVTRIRENGGSAESVCFDLLDQSVVHKFLENELERDGIDVLINNAGFFMPGQIQNEEDGVLERQIEANLYSAYHLTRAILPTLQTQKSGHIFTICSTASITAYTAGGSYCISKFALLGFTKVLREETKKQGIKVTAILPGATLTPAWDGVELPESRFIPADDVASTIYSAYTMNPSTVLEEILIRPQLGDIEL